MWTTYFKVCLTYFFSAPPPSFAGLTYVLVCKCSKVFRVCTIQHRQPMAKGKFYGAVIAVVVLPILLVWWFTVCSSPGSRALRYYHGVHSTTTSLLPPSCCCQYFSQWFPDMQNACPKNSQLASSGLHSYSIDDNILRTQFYQRYATNSSIRQETASSTTLARTAKQGF